MSARIAVAALLLLGVLGNPATALAADGWSPAGSMSTGRFWHQATRLADGRVLVSGGHDAAGFTATTDLYDSVSNTWSPGTSMKLPRGGFTATLLDNGNVLASNGFASLSFDTATSELYDPVTDTWFGLAAMPDPGRDFPAATLLPNGHVLVSGGSGFMGVLAPGELYDPNTNTWSESASMATARAAHTATLLPSGKVLVAGGATGSTSIDTATAELYDPVSDSWSSAGSMATARRVHTATLLQNGKVLITGGFSGAQVFASSELYDPASNSWSPAASMATARYGHTATLLVDGKVLVTGGATASNDAIATAELYDPTTDTWTAAADLPAARWSATATLLTDGLVLLAGGSNSADLPTQAELYTPADLPPPPPSIFITSPVEGGAYGQGQTVPAGYTCTGAAITACDGTVPAGSPFDTATLGPHSFTVDASDASAQHVSKTVHYTVTAGPPPPSITIADPLEGADYGLGQTVLADYACAGTAITACDGTVPAGSPIDTAAAGPHTFTVNASDAGDHHASKSVHYAVTTGPSPPSISIASPLDGGVYGQLQTVRAMYACTGTAITACGGSVSPGNPVDTTVLGSHTFTVLASYANGRRTSRTVRYTVTAAPLLACQRREIAIADLRARGSRVVLAGVAEPSFAGLTVTVLRGSKTAGHATVRSTGTFATTMPAPARAQRKSARYSARVAGQRSRSLRLIRRAHLTRARAVNGRLVLAGRVTRPFEPGATVSIQGSRRCGRPTTIARTHLGRHGTWKLTIAAPADVGTDLFRARVVLPRGTAYTLLAPATG